MASNFFTAFHRALQDDLSYFSFQKEMNLKAVEQVFFNSLAGKGTFDAVVLPERITETSYSPSSKVLRVRPLGIHDFIIPEPCAYAGFPEKIQKIIHLHPVAYPDSNIPLTPGSQEEADTPFAAGEVVECFFLDGPQNTGNLRGLRYRKKKNTTSNLTSIKCITGQDLTMADAFNFGGFKENLPIVPEKYTGPIGVVDVNHTQTRKYQIPPSGKGTIDPKHIVIHYGASKSALGDQSYGAKKKPTPAGYHFAVTRKGQVIQFMDPTRRVVHASSNHFNNSAIAINFENVGFAREDFPAQSDWVKATNQYSKVKGTWQNYTNQQVQAGAKLLAWICKTFSLDPTGTSSGYPTIVGHDYVTVEVEKLNKRNKSKVKSDPGPAFPMEGIRSLAKIKLSEV